MTRNRLKNGHNLVSDPIRIIHCSFPKQSRNRQNFLHKFDYFCNFLRFSLSSNIDYEIIDSEMCFWSYRYRDVECFINFWRLSNITLNNFGNYDCWDSLMFPIYEDFQMSFTSFVHMVPEAAILQSQSKRLSVYRDEVEEAKNYKV